MAEDLPSREILKQLVERIDLLERVLGMTTARLHAIEQHLGIIRQPQPLPESPAGQSNFRRHAAVPGGIPGRTPGIAILSQSSWLFLDLDLSCLSMN